MKPILRAAVSAVCLGAASPALALNICIEGSYPPFSEVAEDGSLVGFDIDIANALCSEMGETCTLVKVEWNSIIPALLDHECDAIVASMSITPERAQVIDFTDKYYTTPARFVGLEGTDLADSAEGMAGRRIGVQRGSIHQTFVEARYPDSDVVLYDTQEMANLDLALGRLDAVMADSIMLDIGFLRTRGGQGFAFFGAPHLDPLYHGKGIGIGIRKEDTELRENFNGAIAAIRDSGVYDQIVAKYFDFDIYGS